MSSALENVAYLRPHVAMKPIHNPVTGERLGEVPLAETQHDAKLVLQRASAGLKEWSSTALWERAEVGQRFASLLAERAD